MVIREISKEKCLQVLAGVRLARLGCAHENQPYVIPVYFAYHQPSGGDPCLYGFSTPGQKVVWMRANPLVCVEVDEVAAYDQWLSVIAFGRYEELPDTPEENDERLRAWQILKSQPVWWQPGSTVWAARAHGDPAEPFTSIYYRIRIDRVTGHEATRDDRDAISHIVPARPTGRWQWLRRTLTGGFGGSSKGAGSGS